MSEPALRADAIRESGVFVADHIHATLACTSCHRPPAHPIVLSVGEATYRTFADLERAAWAHALDKQGYESLTCDHCKGALVASHEDFHTYLEAYQRDLVLRCLPRTGFFTRKRLELYWWSAEDGYVARGPLKTAELEELRRCAYLRAPALRLKQRDRQVAVELVKEAMEAIEGEARLLQFASLLTDNGEYDLAIRLCEQHVLRHPNDARAHFHLGEIAFRRPVAKDARTAALMEAETHVSKAVRMRSDYPEAELLLANLMRSRQQFVGARLLLNGLLDRDASVAEAHYGLGLMALDTNPATALRHFSEGERHRPNEGDYPIARAKALVKLGRKAEARRALERARALVPESPRIAELEAMLTGAPLG